jgi:catechol 2,3-dioxygenase-like lactoylglutathione lyase family enzyme
MAQFIPVSLHHVGITVSNLERSLVFYRDAFGLTPAFTTDVYGPGVAEMVQVPNAHFRIALVVRP